MYFVEYPAARLLYSVLRSASIAVAMEVDLILGAAVTVVATAVAAVVV